MWPPPSTWWAALVQRGDAPVSRGGLLGEGAGGVAAAPRAAVCLPVSATGRRGCRQLPKLHRTPRLRRSPRRWKTSRCCRTPRTTGSWASTCESGCRGSCAACWAGPAWGCRVSTATGVLGLRNLGSWAGLRCLPVRCVGCTHRLGGSTATRLAPHAATAGAAAAHVAPPQPHTCCRHTLTLGTWTMRAASVACPPTAAPPRSRCAAASRSRHVGSARGFGARLRGRAGAAGLQQPALRPLHAPHPTACPPNNPKAARSACMRPPPRRSRATRSWRGCRSHASAHPLVPLQRMSTTCTQVEGDAFLARVLVARLC